MGCFMIMETHKVRNVVEIILKRNSKETRSVESNGETHTEKMVSYRRHGHYEKVTIFSCIRAISYDYHISK